MIRIWSTLSEKKEDLPERRPLRIFVCGPTVYNLIHIGNARTFLAFDLFARYLRFEGIKYFYLQNITDVDDKIIARAAEEGVSSAVIAKRYEKAFRAAMNDLGVDSVTRYARATDHIQDIVAQVKTLIRKGNVYKIDNDGWYFDLSTFPEYGKLARRTLEQAEDGVSRIDESSLKRNRGDFCVWKFTPPDSGPAEPSWKTELGAGRPGWHIEDTAITEHFFGPQYEIHGGGLDLKFPHHEAEITQQESASGKSPLAKIWMHAGLMLVDGEKMSKSKGNFLTVEDMLRTHSAETFRMLVLAHHYRSPLNYTEEAMDAAAKNLEDIRIFIAKLEKVQKRGSGARMADIREYRDSFRAALADDFNTPESLAAIMSFMNEVNRDLWDISPQAARDSANFVKDALTAWGFSKNGPKIPLRARMLADRREKLRRNKQFTQSDALREKMERLGYRSEDTPLGPFVWPIPPNSRK